MAATVSFDTLKVVERLEKAGCLPTKPKLRQRYLAEIMVEEAERVADRFATKADFTQELAGLHADINALRLEFKTMNSDTKAELVRWVVGVGVLQMALIAGLMLKLVH